MYSEPGYVRHKGQTGDLLLQIGYRRLRRTSKLIVFNCESAPGFCSAVCRDDSYFYGRVRIFEQALSRDRPATRQQPWPQRPPVR
jgi:hypothetical protein